MEAEQQRIIDYAVTQLNQLDRQGDAEILHGMADDILCEVLSSLGASAVAEAFDNAKNRVGFWYA